MPHSRSTVVLLAALAASGCNWVLGMDDVERAPESSAKAGSGSGAVPSGGAGGSEPKGVGGAATAGTAVKTGGGTSGSDSGAAGTHAGAGPSNGGEATGQGGTGTGDGGTTMGGGEPNGASGGDPGPDCNDAGNSPDDALPLGVLPTSELTCKGYVKANSDDWFSLSIPEIGTLTYSVVLTDGGGVKAYLFPDQKGVFDQSPLAAFDSLVTSSEAPSATHAISLAAGKYYLQTTGGGVIYDLHVAYEPYAPTSTEPEPDPPPGDNPDDACPLGELEAGQVPKYRGFVGGEEADDYYRFRLTDNGVLRYSLDQVEGSVTGLLYDDVSPLMSGMNPSPPVTKTYASPEISLQAGSYLFRVTPNARSLYTLVLSVYYP